MQAQTNKRYRVKTALRLRSSPQIMNGNIITVLPPDTIATATDSPSAPGWVGVSVTLSGKELKGFVSGSYIELLPFDEPAPVHIEKIAAVHMPERKGTARASANGRAYALSEPNMPHREATADAPTKIDQVYQILDFLDVEHSLRYQPGKGVTYCNIYAYDFCCLSGVYMPRVWWSGKALAQLAQGIAQPVKYGDTVNELNANSLFDWFRDFGPDFGWERIFDTDELQQKVNEGRTGIIVSQRTVLSRSGHIVGVIPETSAHQAVRVNGRVNMPLMSQAGVKNKKVFSSQWYLSANFRQYGFWIHH
ncbi:MAG: hypothetical protein BGO69_11965 [Bacteroidetes bacterium 46-16]|nr:MAG: hypothetical protein BGO69_11965 [Bacteroidetes bacterium 46-16]